MNHKLFEYRHLVISITWLLLMLFFTYTPLIHFIFTVTDTTFIEMYCNNQYSGISTFVNLGLLLMLIVDLISAKRKPTYPILLGFVVAVLLIFGIYFHTGSYIANELSEYSYPISEQNLSLWLHLTFILILLFIKIETLKEPNMDYLVIQKEF